MEKVDDAAELDISSSGMSTTVAAMGVFSEDGSSAVDAAIFELCLLSLESMV